MKNLLKIFSIVILSSFLFGCQFIFNSYSEAATVTRDTLVDWRDSDIEYWEDYLENRTLRFEEDIAEFRASVLLEAESEGILNAEGVLNLDEREQELRSQFQDNLNVQLERLQGRIDAYNELIYLQEEVIVTSDHLSSVQVDSQEIITGLLLALQYRASSEKISIANRIFQMIRDGLSPQGSTIDLGLSQIPSIDGPEGISIPLTEEEVDLWSRILSVFNRESVE